MLVTVITLDFRVLGAISQTKPLNIAVCMLMPNTCQDSEMSRHVTCSAYHNTNVMRILYKYFQLQINLRGQQLQCESAFIRTGRCLTSNNIHNTNYNNDDNANVQ